MNEKTSIEWQLDQEDVILKIEVRMNGAWFMKLAIQIYQKLSLPLRPADRLIESDDEVK